MNSVVNVIGLELQLFANPFGGFVGILVIIVIFRIRLDFSCFIPYLIGNCKNSLIFFGL